MLTLYITIDFERDKKPHVEYYRSIYNV
jgi:hypothetical protein